MSSPGSNSPNIRLLIAVALLAAAVLPFLVGDYRTLQLTMVLIYAMALLGLNLLTGFNGQVSLGHGAFFAIGAYIQAILMAKAGFPYWAAIPIAGFVCLIVGFLFGLPALRMEGPYLALSTFSLAVATPQILKLHALEPWTGGVQGLLVAQVSVPAGLPLTPDQWLYFLCLLIAALMFLVAWNLVRGRVGLAMVAIRDHPLAAAGMGIDTAMVKSMTFAFSALYTGIAGALGALAAQFASPESFSIFLSISFLVGIVLGGIGTISGAFFGALFIQFVPNLAEQVSQGAPWMVYGVFLLVCMYLMPGGAAELMRRLAARLAWSGRTDSSQTDDRVLMMIAEKSPSTNQSPIQTVTRKPCRLE